MVQVTLRWYGLQLKRNDLLVVVHTTTVGHVVWMPVWRRHLICPKTNMELRLTRSISLSIECGLIEGDVWTCEFDLIIHYRYRACAE